MNEQVFHLGVKALITNIRKEILVFEINPKKLSKGLKGFSGKSYWDLPGGRVKKGSTIESTLKREFFEETGVKSLEVVKCFDYVVSGIMVPDEKYSEAGLILVIYKCTLSDNQPIRISNEHKNYKWVTIEVARKLLLHKFGKEFCEKLSELA